MQKAFLLIKNNFQIFGVIVLLMCILFFVRHKLSYTNKNGGITVAKVIRYEGAESGSDLYIEIHLEGKTYTTSVDQECQHDCIGNYFFVKVLKGNPTSYVTFYGNNKVPDCIIKNEKYFKGWKEIPICDNY